MSFQYSLHNPEVTRLLSVAGLTLVASSVSQPAFSQSLPPLVADDVEYQPLPELPIVTNLDVLRPSTSPPENFPNEFRRKSAVTYTETSPDGRYKLIRRLSPISRVYRVPSPEDTESTRKLGGRALGAVELAEVFDTQKNEKIKAAIPLCSVRNGKAVYPSELCR